MKPIIIALLIALSGGAGGYFFRTSGDAPAEKHSSDTAKPTILTETDWNDYLWPTDAGIIRTSDFAEFRATHFHAGIDVSTNMRNGYNVFATRSGWLHSISFEPGGYGWILTLRHNDGYYSCYAHLKGFPDNILNAYRKKLVQSGHSYGYAEWAKGECNVKKGDTVAYTGDSGAGPPHLHFEIRDKEYNPVNPGLSGNLRPLDTIPPEPRQLCFIPLDASSMVNGKYEPLFVNVGKNAKGEYKLSGTPALFGRIGIMTRIHDYAQGAQDYPTPHSIVMTVDGKIYFQSKFDRFQKDLGWHIRIDRDHHLMQKMKGEFRKLFREEGNELCVYDPDDFDAGVLSETALGSGKKRLSITASDISGNKSRIDFECVIVPNIEVSIKLDNHLSASVIIDKPEKVSALRLSAQKSDGKWTLLHERKNELARKNSFSLPESGYRILKVEAIDTRGMCAMPLYAALVGSQQGGNLSVSREFFFDEVVYTIQTNSYFSSQPEIAFKQGERSGDARVFAISPSTYRAVIKTWSGFGGRAQTEIRASIGGVSKQWSEELVAFHVSPSGGSSILSSDGLFSMQFAKGDVYRPMLCWVEEKGDSLTRQYLVYPADIPLAGAPSARICVSERDKQFCYVKASHPTARLRAGKPFRTITDNSVKGSFGRFLGAYSLARDDMPPQISISYAPRNSMPVRIKIADSLSGIVAESIIARIDGNIVPLEYSEGMQVFYIPEKVFRDAKGTILTVSASDAIGNVAQKEYRIR